MDDLLLVAGLGCLVYAAFLAGALVGFVVLGAALVLLSFAAKDVKIKLPRLKLKVRPWRS
jgi:hypothetical protein